VNYADLLLSVLSSCCFARLVYLMAWLQCTVSVPLKTIHTMTQCMSYLPCLSS